jgi:hypothetical protein
METLTNYTRRLKVFSYCITAAMQMHSNANKDGDCDDFSAKLVSALVEALAVDDDADVVVGAFSEDSDADAESKDTSGSMVRLPEPTSAALLSELSEVSAEEE